MNTVMLVVGLLVLAVLGYLATRKGAYHIDRSLLINAPLERVYATVVDFKTWPQWSPWLLHEPDCKLEYSDNYRQPGGYYSWDGTLVGAGTLTHVQQVDNESLLQRIEFKRPFKSSSEVSWTFAAVGEQTEVHWIMRGNMPFLFRFMTNTMQSMIEKDYDLGLNLLNGYLNEDNPHPRIRFIGRETLQDFNYLHRSFSGYLPDMVEAMSTGFPELVQQAESHAIASGKRLTLYHKVDPEKMYFECDMAVPVDAHDAPNDLEIRHFRAGSYYKLEMTGDYRFLELAWYKAYCHVQMLKLKLDKKRPSLEVYENDPQTVSHSGELLTSIYLPIK